ncbi:helix-turn-helix domain-containing protein [Taklimakanibacter deserti]|uniref:helix-turn-helix domain-containing protein n=1 Tax=Taklimakanibacter deserti TaxID=2267839 RepID=UPI000E650589
MFLVFEDRPSDSPFIERVWHCHSERAGLFHSIASPHWEMAVTRHRGRTYLTIRGPETKATMADCPADGEWLGIRFKLGTFMPKLPVSRLIDRQDVDLPSLSDHSFWFEDDVWEYPSFENAESFVARLVKNGFVSRDGAVQAALAGDHEALSLRSIQRHFRMATGMTQATYRQIERARHATQLLRRGVSILDTVHEAGFFDQSHLARSIKRLIGQTPADVLSQEEQLSFLYKTASHS